MSILPFSVPGMREFETANGIAQLNADRLQIEVEIKVNWFGTTHTRIIEIQIPYHEISSVVLKSNWFVNRLIIQTRHIATVRHFPEQESGKISLDIARGDRKNARVFAAQLQANIIELELNRLDRLSLEIE